MLINGSWQDDGEVVRTDPEGQWRRAPSVFRNWVTRDGSPGPDGSGGFAAAGGRYHLFAAWNCPWAHRALLARVAKRLEAVIPVSFVAPRRTDSGWIFDPPAGYVDDLFGSAALHEIYTRGDPDFTGRVTVPLLWDTETGRAVSNESADIVRMFNGAFAGLADASPDLYPADLREEIDAWNSVIHPRLNNGVYRSGFASTQSAYDEAVAEVFQTLDAIEERLEVFPYLAGDRFTEADLRLFPTLVRFDVGYFFAFKCNRTRLIDFPNLWAYARRLYAIPGFADTVRFDIYRRGYHSPSARRNPHGIVPVAPDVDWTEPVRSAEQGG